MIYRLTIFLSVVLWSAETWSQQEGSRVDHRHREQTGHAFMFSADYANNANILGGISPVSKQPYFSPSVSFFSKWNLDVSVIGYAVNNSDDSLDHFTTEADLVAGYGFEPIRNLVIYPSYTHFIYSRNSNSMKSIFSDDIHLDIDYSYKFADLGISAGYLTGQKHTFYAALHHFYLIKFNHVISRKGYLVIQPGLDANFGDYEYLNLYYLEKLNESGSFYNYLNLRPYVRQYVNMQKMKYPYLRKEHILYSYLRNRAKDNFKFTSAAISVPITYTYGNISMNLGMYVCIPVNQPDYLNDNVQFFFDLGLTFLLIPR
jgi:hypothetical protein